MRDRLDEFAPATTVVLITFTGADALSEYVDRQDLPFAVVTDSTRDAYRAYGLGRGAAHRVWGWRAAKRYWEIIRHGGLRDVRPPTEDSLQLGGDFVIAPDGTLAWGFWSAGPDDRPSIDTLIAAT